LSRKKERLVTSAFLVEGPRAATQVTASSPDSIIEILATDEVVDTYNDYPTRLISESQLKSISSTQHPQGPIAVVRLPVDTYSSDLPDDVGNRLLLLEDVQDPGNVGALIRTAAAFDFDGIILTPKCADPLSPKCVQASAGTVLSLWLRVADDYLSLSSAIKDKGYTLVAADLGGSDDISALNKDKLLLALGNEANGLSLSVIEIADIRFKIHINQGKAESLNVAACGAVCMYLSYANLTK
ncbi:TrmH family RNA methyltransferase, partial [Chloroflexota bacterium]